ncbi:TPA: hypothetical protein ACGO3M_000520 [Streptococcus suis]
MAFEKNEDLIIQALGKEQPTNEKLNFSTDLPIAQPFAAERKKNYTFTLRPSMREKLDLISKQRGYRSSSELLDKWIESL